MDSASIFLFVSRILAWNVQRIAFRNTVMSDG